MQDTISFTNALWLAGIAPTLGFIGVIVTLIVNARMARGQAREEANRTREQLHADSERAQLDRVAQRDLERDRLLRQERVRVYADLIAAAGEVLSDTMQSSTGLPSNAKSRPRPGAARGAWASALAGAQLIGADAVVAVAEEIDRKSKERYRLPPGELARLAGTAAQPDKEEESEDARKEKFDLMLRTIVEHGEENNELQRRLAEACRQSLAETAPK